jgi:hypothetical protein
VLESPYHVTGDLLIEDGDSLRIEPGVEMVFDGFYTLKVNGTLTARGTVSDSILFDSGQSIPVQGDWFGIFFQNASSESRIEFASIRYSAHGVSFNNTAGRLSNSSLRFNTNAIECAESSTPLIQYNVIERNFNAGLRVTDSSPVVKQNRFYHNSEDGFEPVVLFTQNSGGVFVQNIVAFNGLSAIDCIDSSSTSIINNTIANNLFGVLIEDATASIYSNIVVNNTMGIILSSGSADIRYNDVWNNSDGNYFNTPASVGQVVGTNEYGDPIDIHGNVTVDPIFINGSAKNFMPRNSSHVIDIGDPANPGGISFLGTGPDMGAVEFSITSVPGDNAGLDLIVPSEMFLVENYPNPFSTQTTFSLSLRSDGILRGSLYNMLGQRVATIMSESWRQSGEYASLWNGTDDYGQVLSNGVYFARFELNGFAVTKRITLNR